MFEDLIRGMVKALVDDPDKIDIRVIDRDDGVKGFELRVAKEDRGKVIGKRGRTASAMRTILSAAARKQQINADLQIIED